MKQVPSPVSSSSLATARTEAALKTARALRRLPEMGERVIDGVLWTKMGELLQYKLSLYGAQGDYDRDCSWVDFGDEENVLLAAANPSDPIGDKS